MRVSGAPLGDASLITGRASARDTPGLVCRLGVRNGAEGQVITVPRLPEHLLTDQEAALEAMVEAVRYAGPVEAVGLGSLLAVVAGRGVSLAERVSVPVTTGAAATSWAAVHNALDLLQGRDQPVVVLGFSSVVGQQVARALSEAGVRVIAGGSGKALARKASRLGVPLVPEADAAGQAELVLGCATTGGTLDPRALRPGATLLDVALPPTLKPGPRPEGVQVLAGEAVELPTGWTRGIWGRLYHVFSGYGLNAVYACLLEPMVMAVHKRKQPFALGRKVDLPGFTAAAADLGLRPRLARH